MFIVVFIFFICMAPIEPKVDIYLKILSSYYAMIFCMDPNIYIKFILPAALYINAFRFHT